MDCSQATSRHCCFLWHPAAIDSPLTLSRQPSPKCPWDFHQIIKLRGFGQNQTIASVFTANSPKILAQPGWVKKYLDPSFISFFRREKSICQLVRPLVLSYHTSIYTARHAQPHWNDYSAVFSVERSVGCTVEIDVVSSMVASLH